MEVKYISMDRSLANLSFSADKIDSFSIDDSFSLALFGDFFNVLGEDSFLWVVHFRKLGGIDFWSLDDFDFSYFNVLDGVNVRDFLGDFLLDDFRGEKLQDVSGVGLGDFFGDDFVHFSSDGFLL